MAMTVSAPANSRLRSAQAVRQAHTPTPRGRRSVHNAPQAPTRTPREPRSATCARSMPPQGRAAETWGLATARRAMCVIKAKTACHALLDHMGLLPTCSLITCINASRVRRDLMRMCRVPLGASRVQQVPTRMRLGRQAVMLAQDLPPQPRVAPTRKLATAQGAMLAMPARVVRPALLDRTASCTTQR